MTGKHLPVQDEFLLTTCPFGVKMMFLAVSLAFLASTAKALGQSNLPPVTLVPAHPPGHDAYDLDHLVPDIQQSLHFRESAMSGMYHPSLPQSSS